MSLLDLAGSPCRGLRPYLSYRNPKVRLSAYTDLAILNCKVTKTGPVPITIKDASGDVLFTTTLTVPQPQVAFIASEGTNKGLLSGV